MKENLILDFSLMMLVPFRSEAYGTFHLPISLAFVFVSL